MKTSECMVFIVLLSTITFHKNSPSKTQNLKLSHLFPCKRQSLTLITFVPMQCTCSQAILHEYVQELWKDNKQLKLGLERYGSMLGRNGIKFLYMGKSWLWAFNKAQNKTVCQWENTTNSKHLHREMYNFVGFIINAWIQKSHWCLFKVMRNDPIWTSNNGRNQEEKQWTMMKVVMIIEVYPYVIVLFTNVS